MYEDLYNFTLFEISITFQFLYPSLPLSSNTILTVEGQLVYIFRTLGKFGRNDSENKNKLK